MSHSLGHLSTVSHTILTRYGLVWTVRIQFPGFIEFNHTHTDPDLVVPGARQRASVKRGKWRVFRFGRNASHKDTFIAVLLLLPVALQLRSPSLHNNKLFLRPGVDYSHYQHDGAKTLLRRRKGGATR